MMETVPHRRYESGALPRLSYVIPVLNERESLKELHRRICAATERVGCQFEVLFVDDGSTDGSFDLIGELNRHDPRVRALRFGKNRGKSAALEAGFRAAMGEVIVTMDADLQDDPDEVPRMLEAMAEHGYDVVSGWKKERKDPFGKRFMSRIFNGVTGYFSGLRLHDFNCGFKAYRREVTDNLRVYGEMHRFLPVLAFWNGFQVGELVVRHHARRYGASHYGASRIVKGLFDFVTVMFLVKFGRRPLHLFGTVGLACLMAGTGVSLFFAAQWMMGYPMRLRPIMVGGWVLILIGIQFFSIGLLGEMLVRGQLENERQPVQDRVG
ncbi:MAG: glycosyltransferase family 2 protein [Nitrospirota bacterium]|nr:glycosyltransferase family 2 protein [Nitrospirota bacterium]